MAAGRLVVVVCSPRVPAGLLSWPAWQALQRGPVLVADAAHRQLPALRAAGVEVDVVPADVAQRRVAAGEQVVWLAGDDDGNGDGDGDGGGGGEGLAGRADELVVASHDPPGPACSTS